MGMFNKIGKKALGGIGRIMFKGKKKAAMAASPAVQPVAMDPTATPSTDVPVATQPSDSPFAAASTAARAKMPAKKVVAPAGIPRLKDKRFGQMVRKKAY